MSRSNIQMDMLSHASVLNCVAIAKLIGPNLWDGFLCENGSRVLKKNKNGRNVDLTQLLRLAKNDDNKARADVIRVAYEDLKRVAEAQMRDQRQDHILSTC